MKTAYDKLLLFIALFILLLSVVLLGFFVDSEKKELTAARWSQPDIPPKKSKPVDTTSLQEAIEHLVEPFQMDYGSNRMMVAERRVACVKCGRPIPYSAEICPFKNCGVLQPAIRKTPMIDADLDRMPDEWEKKYGLNPTIDDAQKDADADSFSNLEEFLHGTNPRDPADYPPPVSKLKWVKTGRIPMPFSFQSIQRPATNEVRYVVKNRKTGQDFYLKIGDKVDGYEVIGYEENKIEVKKPGLPAPLMEDVSVLKLRKDDKVIALTRGQDAGLGEMAADLIFLIDNSKYRVKVNDVITLKNNRYKIVDIKKDAVVVSDSLTGKETSLEPYSETDRRVD